jgi:hypothetical protein
LWHELGPFTLEAGEELIGIGSINEVELDEILLYSLKDEETSLSLNELFDFSEPAVSISHEALSPCTYRVHVNASEPFNLVFSDTFNPLWKAIVDGKEIQSALAYSMVNSYHIDKIGQFTLTVYFAGQDYADQGITISLASLTSITIAMPIYCLLCRKRRLRTHKT